MTKRKVRIFITSRRWGNPRAPFAPMEELCEEECDGECEEETDEADDEEVFDTAGADGEPIELMTEGRLVTGESRVELVYDEGALSGMEGSVTSLGFDRRTPQMLTMLRSGTVRTAMVFEERRRHMSVYETPFVTFSVCVTARKVVNRLLEDGTVELRYTTAVNGHQTELCHMTVRVLPAD